MSLIEKYIMKSENKWLWFIITICGSFIPLIFRYVVSLGFPTTSNFDIKDVLFAGLAMNLSNFNLLSSKNFKAKVVIALLSSIMIAVIAVLISIFLAKENDKINSLTLLQLLSVIFVLFSIYMSYETNNFVLKK